MELNYQSLILWKVSIGPVDDDCFSPLDIERSGSLVSRTRVAVSRSNRPFGFVSQDQASEPAYESGCRAMHFLFIRSKTCKAELLELNARR